MLCHPLDCLQKAASVVVVAVAVAVVGTVAADAVAIGGSELAKASCYETGSESWAAVAMPVPVEWTGGKLPPAPVAGGGLLGEGGRPRTSLGKPCGW